MADSQVISVSDSLKTSILIAFAQRQMFLAQLSEAQVKLDVLIEKLDKDGALKKAIADAGVSVNRYQAAEAKLNALFADAQKEVGMDLTGYTLNADDGTFKAPPAPVAPTASVPATEATFS